jgi:hypothetical protein
MDAVNRYWQILRALVLVRPVIAVVLGLFYLVAAFLVLTVEPDKKATAIALLSAIPTCGFFAIATERLVQYAAAGSSLGIPDNSESLRRGQVWLMATFIGVPLVVGLGYGGQPSYMALLFAPAATGVLLALYARWAFVAWITIAVATRFTYSFGAAMPGLSDPWVRVALIAASVGVLYWWFGLARRTEQRNRGVSLRMADAKHERSTDSIGEALGVDPVHYGRYEQAYEREISTVTAGIADTGISRRALQTGLAIDVRPQWRTIAITVGIGWLILLVFHGSYPRQTQPTIYTGISLLAAVTLFSNVNVILAAWRLRDTEEALLALTPRWPTESRLKKLFVELIVESQIGTWLGWSAISLPFYLLGWGGPTEARVCVLIMVGASSGAGGSLLVALSRKSNKEISLVTIALLLCCSVGVATYLSGSEFITHARILGAFMIGGPLIIGVLCFAFRPLQFPVRRISKR